MDPPRPRRRFARVLVIVVLGLVGLVALSVAAAVLLLQGERLGRLLGGVLADTRGKVQVRSVRWPARLLVNLLTDAPTPVWIEGVKITDAEGVLVLEAPRIEVKVRPRSAIKTKIYLSDLRLGPDSFWRFAPLKTHPEDNGFLTSFASKVSAATPPAPVAPTPADGGGGFVLEIANADLDGLTAVFDFPDAWALELRNIKTAVSLMVDGDFVGWDVVGLEARNGGYLRILDDVLPFDRVSVNRVATTRDWPNNIFLDLKAAMTRRTTLSGKGFFTGIYGYKGDPAPAGIDLHAEFAEAADALGAVAAGRNIPGLRLEGRGATLVADLKDPFARLKIAGRLAGLDVSFGAYAARDLVVGFKVVVDPLSVLVDELTFAAPGGGRFALKAAVKAGARPGEMSATARLRLDRFTTDSYVPPGFRRTAAGRITGGLSVVAALGPHPNVSVDGIDLALARSRAGGLPSSLRVSGQASASAERISTKGLNFEIPGASAEIRGEVELARRLAALGLRASTSNLPLLLTSLGLPPLARAAALSIDVEGPFKQPRLKGDAVVRGIGLGNLPEVPELKARFSFADGTARLDSLSGSAFEGTLSGQGQIELFRKSVDHLLREPLVDFRLEGQSIELGSLIGSSLARGHVSFVASARGPLDKIRARLQLPPGAQLRILGDPWELGGIDVEVDQRSVVVHAASLARSGGARIEVSGQMAFGGTMAWDVAVHDVALAGLPWLVEAGVPVSGFVSAQLRAGGSLARPTLAGEIVMTRVVAMGLPLGDGRLVLAPTATGGIGVKGDLFHLLRVSAAASYGPDGPRAKASVAFDHLVIEQLLGALGPLAPKIAALGDMRGLASGQVSVDWSPDAPLTVDARLSELSVALTRQPLPESADTTPRRVQVRNAGQIRVVLVGDRIIIDESRFVTDGGELKIRAELNGDAISAAILGHLDLDLLQPFLGQTVERLTGDVAIELTASGTRTRPLLAGSIRIANGVKLKVNGFDPEITVPSGGVSADQRGIKLSDLAIRVDGATLTLRGAADLDATFKPTRLELDADGEVSARLLETLAPDAVSDASGKARIHARITGTPEAPKVSAKVSLGEIDLRLRGLGRSIAVASGTLELTSDELVLRDVRATIDDQGVLSIGADGTAPGRVAIKSLYPKLSIGAVTLPLGGDRLTYRVPDTVEVDDLGFKLELAGDLDDGFALTGDVRVVSGRYIQDFAVRNLVLSPRTNESAARPFYENKPLLENLALDLRVRTIGDSFVVQNNLAPEMHMILDLHVGGTLSEPEIAGELRPTDGRFHILGFRGDFELLPNVNHVTFVDTKSIAAGETPELNLEAQNLITDSTGNEHVVHMRVSGPVGQAAIDLSSEDGLDRNQTLLLLLSGRTTDEAGEFGSHNPTLGSNVRSGTDMVGQITRDGVSNLVEPYIDDTLQVLTGRKLNLRPTVGADGFELKLAARASRQLDLQLSFLQGFQNQRRSRAEASVWLMDYVTLRGVGEQLTFAPQQGITEDVSTLRMELTLDLPIRLRLSR